MDKKPTPHSSHKQTLIFSVLVVVVCLVILDMLAIAAERIWPAIPMDVGLGFTPESRVFVKDETDSSNMLTNPNKLLWFSKQSFPIQKANGTLRIAALGGSSVNHLQIPFERLMLYPPRDFPAHIKRLEFINTGGNSYGSHRLLFVAAEVASYQPDVVFIYTGHNEFEEQKQLELAQLDTTYIQDTINKFALTRFIRDRITNLAVDEMKRAQWSKTLDDGPAIEWTRYSPDQITERMHLFKQNLTRIVELFENAGITVLIGTVPSNMFAPALPPDERHAWEAVKTLQANGNWEQARIEAERLLAKSSFRHQSSALENAVIREIASSHHLLLVDVEKAIIETEPNKFPGETLFADHCHLNGAGNAILMETLLNTLRNMDDLRTP